MKLYEAMNKYNLTESTIKNWYKEKYIYDLNDISEYEIDKIIKNKLSKRRNKKNSTNYLIPTSYINDNNILNTISNIIDLKNEFNISNKETIHEVIIKLIENKNIQIPDEVELVLGSRTNNIDFIDSFKKINIVYSNENDFLGCLYMSLISIGSKDTNGIFYTPFNVVDEIISLTDFNKTSKVLDPGCGSGNFLIKVYKEMKSLGINTNEIINNLYGCDIDSVAVLIAKINIYLMDKDINYNNINIKCIDYLYDDIDNKFDIIIGNPPWGKKYNKKERDLLSQKYGNTFSNSDSFSQFIIKSFDYLNDFGQLAFVLPTSILNIETHKNIRNFLLNYDIKYIKQMGREFKEIYTDVIILKVCKTHNKNNKCYYNDKEIEQVTFEKNHNNNFLITSDFVKNILDKIKKYNSFHLDTKDIYYGLGIVTGNNKKYLSNEQKEGYVPIISGKEITRYITDYTNLNNYIIFKKENFQQVANEDIYRNKNKIIYKFIGKNLMFAVENNSILTLNSANVISFSDNYDIYYISAILNSRITQLFFDEVYNTHKVLRNHIESFNIFEFNDEDKKTISNLCKNIKHNNKLYNEKIEDIIYKNLNLTDEEIFYLKGRYK